MTEIQEVIPSSPDLSSRFRVIGVQQLDALTRRAGLDEEQRLAARAVAAVLPFRVNSYVIDELIDWDAAPRDPMYRLVFPQPDMLPDSDLDTIRKLLAEEVPPAKLRSAANEIRMRLNPHPAGQLTINAPSLNGPAFRGTAQVPGNGAVLPEAGPDVSLVLHVLLPLGAVRRGTRTQDGH